MIANGYSGQSIYDVALQHYGSVEGIVLLLEDNTQLIGSVHPYGQNMKVRDQYIDKTIATKIFGEVKTPISN